MPLLSSTAAPAAMRELQLLAQKLDQSFRNEDPRPYMADLEASATGLNGMGGLLFQAKAPPGQGRLIRLPFYLYEGDKTQARFVQGYYSKDDVFQVETLTITSGGSGIAAQSLQITLGGASLVIPGVATGSPSAIAAVIASTDFSSLGRGWTAFNAPGSPNVVFTCLQTGYVSGPFSFSATTGALIAGDFVRTQSGRAGRKEIGLALFTPQQFSLNVDYFITLGTTGEWGPVNINLPPSAPPLSNLQNAYNVVYNDIKSSLPGLPGFGADWTVTDGPTTTVVTSFGNIFARYLQFESVNPGFIGPPFSSRCVPGPPTVDVEPIVTSFVLSQRGVDPRPEIRTLTITNFGSGPDTVDLTLNGVLFPAIPVAGGVSNAAVAASIAAAPYAGWTAVQIGDAVQFTSTTNAALNGTYSLVWASGSLITGSFTETTPGSSREWVAANQPLWVTGKGVEEVDDSNPTVLVTIPNAPGASAVRGFRFRTPVLEWAKLRVVGFEVSTRPVPRGEYAYPPIFNEVWPQVPMRGNDIGIDYSNPPPNTMSSNALVPMSAKGYSAYWRGSAPILLAKNLSVGGSANLFIQEGYIDTIAFSDGVPEFPGLRAYPVLEPPNRAYVDAAVSGQPLTGMTFSMCLLCDILDDADFGAPISGPYDRRDAMMRFDPPDGQGYVR